MNPIYVAIYLICFCLIAGGAFAMMYANIQSIWNTPPSSPTPRHPEAPGPDEEVMYVDLSREKLEELYKDK